MAKGIAWIVELVGSITVMQDDVYIGSDGREEKQVSISVIAVRGKHGKNQGSRVEVVEGERGKTEGARCAAVAVGCLRRERQLM